MNNILRVRKSLFHLQNKKGDYLNRVDICYGDINKNLIASILIKYGYIEDQLYGQSYIAHIILEKGIKPANLKYTVVDILNNKLCVVRLIKDIIALNYHKLKKTSLKG